MKSSAYGVGSAKECSRMLRPFLRQRYELVDFSGNWVFDAGAIELDAVKLVKNITRAIV